MWVEEINYPLMLDTLIAKFWKFKYNSKFE